MSKQPSPLTGFEVAVIGMSVRLPGADTLDAFWRNLQQGHCNISHFDDQQLREAGVSEADLSSSSYVKAKGIVNQAMGFEASFFDYTEREALLMDPQLRVYHECVAQALADSGYRQDADSGNIGLYGGIGNNPLWHQQFFSAMGEHTDVATHYQIDNLNSPEYFNTRIAHKLNLIGPAITVQTACSSALVAVHLAVGGLIAADCDIAVAGGVHMNTSAKLNQPEVYGYHHQAGMICSADGHCRPFDAKADGTLFSDGAGCVTLKRLEDAVADGDFIYALIKGSAINNDGADKSGFTAPGVNGQTRVIQAAQAMAEVDADTIGYVEAHGTATNLGDPLEIKALTQAFATEQQQYCYLGSVKANLGHLGSAAGIAGFIKAVLAVKHQQIPANIHFQQPNRALTLEQTPFKLNQQTIDWTCEHQPLRAGVSSFGIGGTNAHVVIEQYICATEQPSSAPLITKPLSKPQALVVSACSENGLKTQLDTLVDFLTKHPNTPFDAAAFTLQQGRIHQPYRKAVVATDLTSAIGALQQQATHPDVLGGVAQQHMLVFAFGGQGSGYPQMAVDFYHQQAQFRHWVDKCFALLEGDDGAALKALFLDSQPQQAVYASENAQPLLFIVEYAMAKYLLGLGVTPWAMTGHSLGEYVAATIAGVFSLADALSLVCLRGKLMATTASGGMLAVAQSVDEVLQRLPQGLAIAAVNTPDSCVVSGDRDLIEDFAQQSKALAVQTVALKTSHAFHSELMRPIVAQFRQLLASVKLNPPTMACISNVTGTWLSAEQATSEDYWCEHLLATVRFSQGLQTLLAQQSPLFIEVGPGRTLSALIKRHIKIQDKDYSENRRDLSVVNLLPHHDQNIDDNHSVCRALAKLHCLGVQFDWSAWHMEQSKRRLPLPGYTFDRKLYIPKKLTSTDPIAKSANQSTGQSTGQSTAQRANNLYQGVWQLACQSPNKQADALNNSGEDVHGLWLFGDNAGLTEQLKPSLVNHYQPKQVIEHSYAQSTDSVQFEQYQSALQQFKQAGINQLTLVFAWTIDLAVLDANPQTQQLWLSLARQWGLLLKALTGFAGEIHVNVLGCENYLVNGLESIVPAQSMLLPMATVAGQENPELDVFFLDIDSQALAQPEPLAQWLSAELLACQRPAVVAYRHQRRWLHHYLPYQAVADQQATFKVDDAKHILITGGLGHLARQLALHLACGHQRKFTLLSRRALPERSLWPELVAKLQKDQQQQSQQLLVAIRSVMAMEQLGAQVQVFTADCADFQMMQQVVTRSCAEFGPIDGVIHCAGLMHSHLQVLQSFETDQLDAHIRAKLTGVEVLNQVLESQPVSFILLMSSLSSLLGGLGLSAYAAANACLDGFVWQRYAQGDRRYVSVNWDTWHDDNVQLPQLMTVSTALRTFDQIMKGPHHPQIINSQTDLSQRIQKSFGKASQPVSINPQAQESGKTVTAPRNWLEQQLVETWQQHLGIPAIDINDNFFDLGGDSLLAVTVFNQLKRSVDVVALGFTVVDYFEPPVISDIAAKLLARMSQLQVGEQIEGLTRHDAVIEQGEF